MGRSNENLTEIEKMNVLHEVGWNVRINQNYSFREKAVIYEKMLYSLGVNGFYDASANLSISEWIEKFSSLEPAPFNFPEPDNKLFDTENVLE